MLRSHNAASFCQAISLHRRGLKPRTGFLQARNKLFPLKGRLFPGGEKDHVLLYIHDNFSVASSKMNRCSSLFQANKRFLNRRLRAARNYSVSLYQKKRSPIPLRITWRSGSRIKIPLFNIPSHRLPDWSISIDRISSTVLSPGTRSYFFSNSLFCILNTSRPADVPMKILFNLCTAHILQASECSPSGYLTEYCTVPSTIFIPFIPPWLQITHSSMWCAES